MLYGSPDGLAEKKWDMCRDEVPQDKGPCGEQLKYQFPGLPSQTCVTTLLGHLAQPG